MQNIVLWLSCWIRYQITDCFITSYNEFLQGTATACWDIVEKQLQKLSLYGPNAGIPSHCLHCSCSWAYPGNCVLNLRFRVSQINACNSVCLIDTSLFDVPTSSRFGISWSANRAFTGPGKLMIFLICVAIFKYLLKVVSDQKQQQQQIKYLTPKGTSA